MNHDRNHALFLRRAPVPWDKLPARALKADTTRRDIPLDILFKELDNSDLVDPMEIGEWIDPECEIVKIDSNWPHGLPETGGAVGSGWTGEVPKKRGRGLSEGKPRIRQFKPKIQ